MTTDAMNIDSIANIGLFRDLTSEECQQILEIAICTSFEPGDVILTQGECSRNLWVVLEGSCNVFHVAEDDGAESLLAEIETDSHFGEMSFFSSANHSATVRAKTAVKLLRLHRPDYDILLTNDSIAAYKLAYNTIGPLSDRIRQFGERWLEISKKATGSEPASEWNKFRGKVFDSWNL